MGNSNGSCMGDGTTANKKKEVPSATTTTTNAPMSISTIPLSHIITFLPAVKCLHQTYLCSSGSKGYCALKEMLQRGNNDISGSGGSPTGSIVLLESGDVREMIAPNYTTTTRCCYLHSFLKSVEEEEVFKHWDSVKQGVAGITIYSNLTELPPFVLLKREDLTSVTMGSMPMLKKIHNHFLSGCSDMKMLDMSSLSLSHQLTDIDSYFLEGCSSLTSLDLSPLSHVTSISYSFLSGCTGLTVLDLSPLSNIDVIPASFLEGCSGLKELDLSPLSKVTLVRGPFLRGCNALKTIDMSPLSAVTEIDDDNFLKKCIHIEVVNAPPLLSSAPPKGWEMVEVGEGRDTTTTTTTTTGGDCGQWKRTA